jgi:hypothetical protein
VLSSRLVPPRAAGSGRGAGLGPLDVALAVAVGALGGVLIAGVPWYFVVPPALLLALLAVTTKVEVHTLADTLLVLSGFFMPMNRMWAVALPGSDLLLVMALGLYLLIRLREGSRDPRRTYRPIVIGLSLLAVGGIVGTLTEVPGPFLYKALGEPLRDVSGLGQNLSNEMKFVLGSFIPISAWILARPDRRLMRRVVGAWAAGAFTSALACFTPFGRGGGTRFVGFTVHPGQLGSLSVLGMGTVLALVLSRRPLHWWVWLTLPVLAYAVLGSGSRAALGATVVFGLIIGPLSRSRAVMGAVGVGIAAVLLVFATGLVKPEGENALGRAFGDARSAQGSDSVREDLHREVFARWEQRPITGNGYNYMRPSHNVYLGIIASAGVLGILGMGTILVTVFRRLWRRRHDLLAVGVGAGYLAYLGAAYYDNIFWWRWLWFYVGMVVAVTTTRPGPEEVTVVVVGERPAVPEPQEPVLGSTR